jgi:hypothetical protein
MSAQVLVWFVMSVCESAYMIEGQSRSEKDNKKKRIATAIWDEKSV